MWYSSLVLLRLSFQCCHWKITHSQTFIGYCSIIQVFKTKQSICHYRHCYFKGSNFVLCLYCLTGRSYPSDGCIESSGILAHSLSCTFFYWSCRRDANQISSDRRNSQYKHVVTRRNAAFLLDWFCNPFLQTCRTLLEKLALDGHLHVRVFEEPVPTAPTMLRALFKQDPSKEPPSCRNRYFANPMSTSQL